MKKTILAATASAALLAAALPALAQSTPETQPGQQTQPVQTQPQEQERQQPRAGRLDRADMEALLDARIAAIQAGLRLDEQQRQLWPAVEQAYRAIASERFARMEERRGRMEERRGRMEERRGATAERGADRARPDFMERLERRSAWTARSAEQVNALATAMRPFWDTLDERQQRLLPILMQPTMGGERGRTRMAGGHRHHGYGMGMHEHGPRWHGSWRGRAGAQEPAGEAAPQ